MPTEKNQYGFTLIEVMVAMILLLIMSLGTLAGLHMTYHRLYKNQYLGEAKEVSRQVMEEAMSTPFDQLNSKTNSTIRFFGNSNKTFTWKRTITHAANHTGTAKVCRVAVSWYIISGGQQFWYNATSIKADL